MVVICAGFYLWYQKTITLPVVNTKTSSFVINSGEGVNTIAHNLYINKLISSPFAFKLYVHLNDYQTSLQAGEYDVSDSKSIKDLVGMFVSGKVHNTEKTIKIIEGWNNKEIAEYLTKNNIVSGEDFLKLINTPLRDWSFSFPKPSFLKQVPDDLGLEGYLFPDTYKIFKDAKPQDIIEKMLNNFSLKITQQMMADIVKQGKTLSQIIIMASIIEKEAPKDEDRPLIAGILYKRLDIGMKLEVDSTINYLTGKNSPGASYQDLDIDSPYNTYKNYGLPPGPICNPGLSAIKAAIYPQQNPYLFYLHRQDTKETIFSKNYQEHLRNKNKYLR